MLRRYATGINGRFGIKNRWLCSFCLVCIGFLAGGCSLSAQRIHPDFEYRIKKVNRAVLVPPDVSMLELMPGGLIRQRGDWSEQSHWNLYNAIRYQLKDRQCSLQPLVLNPDTGRNLQKFKPSTGLCKNPCGSKPLSPQTARNRRSALTTL